MGRHNTISNLHLPTRSLFKQSQSTEHPREQLILVTINNRFFANDAPASNNYCIICFKLSANEMYLISELLRRVFSLEEFRTKRSRMGAVVSVRGKSLQTYRAS